MQWYVFKIILLSVSTLAGFDIRKHFLTLDCFSSLDSYDTSFYISVFLLAPFSFFIHLKKTLRIPWVASFVTLLLVTVTSCPLSFDSYV